MTTAAGPLPFAQLFLFDDPLPRAASMNMAVDEMLLARLADRPTLRLYRWAQPAVSIGCFDPMEPVVQRWPDREVVRRWTGGGVVEHGLDLTFSLLVPRPLPPSLLTASDSYRVIHHAVALALSRVGCTAGTQAASPRPEPGAARACFDHPVPFDLLVGDRKVAGGAQRRTKNGLLHQGSIQGPGIDPPRLAALARELPGVFGREIEPRFLSADELASASQLAETKYGAAAWLRRF